jgi:hypothetical protein
MEFKDFTSDDRWFCINLPLHWTKYVEYEQDTYLFYNEKAWTGNLRVTRLMKDDLADWNTPGDFLQAALHNKDAVSLQHAGMKFVHYTQIVKQQDNELLVYCWAISMGPHLLECSFTLNKNMDQAKQDEELALIKNSITSIQII